MLGVNLAGDDVEQRRLAGAVAADQADPGTGRDAGGGAFEQCTAGYADSEIVDHEHGARLVAEAGAPRNPSFVIPGHGLLPANPESRNAHSICVWIPDRALGARPE
jgi:hypothetical protein